MMAMLLAAKLPLAEVITAVLLVALTAVVAAIAHDIRRKVKIGRGLQAIPGPKGWPLLGILPAFMTPSPRLHDIVDKFMVESGGRMHMPWSILSDSMVFLASAEDVQHVLATNYKNYIRAPRFIASVGKLFGKSFLGINHAHTADNGAMLRLQRKVGIKVFTTSNFRLFSEQIFHKYAEKMVSIIAEQGGKCDMNVISGQYTLQAIFDIACGISLQEVDPQLGRSFMKSMDYVFATISERLMVKPYFKYFWWCMPSEYRMKRNEQVMIALADNILGRRLQESDDEIASRSDIMSLFIRKARELEDGEGVSILDVEMLRSVFLSFLFAGKDSSSSAITYTFYALAQYSQVQQLLYEELQKVPTSGFSYEDIKNLRYLDAVVSETMRLYPTIPSNFKVAVEDDYLPDGTFIPAGTEVTYTAWYMGRHNPIWGHSPLVFRPERWLEMKTRPSAYEFPVFQAGPRVCIGMNMALLEIKMFVAVMIRQFRVQIQPGELVHDRGYIICPTLTMEGGLPLQITRREIAPGF